MAQRYLTLTDKALLAYAKHKDKLPPCEKAYLKRRAAKLYYIKLEFPTFFVYKIGYTSRTLAYRIDKMGLGWDGRAKVIQVLHCPKGLDAYNFEQALHLEYKHHRFYSPKPIIKSGYTELYTYDILELDRGLKNAVSLKYTL